MGIGRCSAIGISAGARPALALAIAAPELIDRLILLSPLQLFEGTELLDLAGVKAATLVLVGTRDTSGAIEAGRLCRERIGSCHLSLVYGAGHAVADDRPRGLLGLSSAISGTGRAVHNLSRKSGSPSLKIRKSYD